MKNEPDEISGGENILDVGDIKLRYRYLADQKDELETALDEAQEDVDENPGDEDHEKYRDDAQAELKDFLGEYETELDGLQEVINEDLSDDNSPLIREEYFAEYAEDLADEIGYIERSMKDKWPFTCIDWSDAADELKSDYSTIDVCGSTYYYRSC